MPRFVAFLRAINVGGHTVTMKTLCEVFDALGLQGVETFLASGNVIFRSRSSDAAAFETLIEKRLEQALGYEVRTFIRTDAEVAAIAGHRPFTPLEHETAGAFNVALLRRSLDKRALTSLMSLKTEIDDFHVRGREIYWLCRRKQSESTFSNARLERTLKESATLRGLQTMVRLSAKYPPST